MAEKICVFAGSGRLPLYVLRSLAAQGYDIGVLRLKKAPLDPEVEAFMEQHGLVQKAFTLGTSGAALDFCRAGGFQKLVLAGGVRRPSLLHLRTDAWTRSVIQKVLKSAVRGDNALLEIVAQALQEEGIEVVSPQFFLPQIFMAAGPLGRHQPTESQKESIGQAVKLLEALSPYDVGQAVVIQQGSIMGVEAIEGTEALIRRLKPFLWEGEKAVLVKIPKKNQDRRMDMPTIGLETLIQLEECGFGGVALLAGESYLLDPLEIIKQADRGGLFVWGLAIAPAAGQGGRG